MTAPATYRPPSSTEMLARQDELKALRYLVAQRRLYKTAKRWLGLRWFGMLVIGLTAPVVSVVEPDLAVVSGAVAGAWIFIGRTVVQFLQSGNATAAAATQEQFDLFVFGMQSSVKRSALPTIEALALLAGPDERINEVAETEKLLGWYPIREQNAGAVSVAICQRANASYSDRLLHATVRIWTVATAIWALLLVFASVAFDLSLGQFLVGVLLPVLPAFLDVVEYILGIRKSARLRRDLVAAIEERLKQRGKPIQAQELLVWQDELFGLRRATPQVPDFVYNLSRSRNERAMHAAASQIGDEADHGSS